MVKLLVGCMAIKYCKPLISKHKWDISLTPNTEIDTTGFVYTDVGFHCKKTDDRIIWCFCCINTRKKKNLLKVKRAS